MDRLKFVPDRTKIPFFVLSVTTPIPGAGIGPARTHDAPTSKATDVLRPAVPHARTHPASADRPEPGVDEAGSVLSTVPRQPRRVTLDATAQARLRELDPDGRNGVIPRVLGAFETSLARMLAQLSAQQDDTEADAGVVLGIAHTLKSSSASVGAMGLAQACADLERQLRGGDSSQLQSELARLIEEGEAALAAVDAMLRP